MSDLDDRLARLLPRLASPSEGERLAVLDQVLKTLDRHGLDIHDFTARATGSPSRARAAPGGTEIELRRMADALRLHAFDHLTERQRDFVANACRRLAAGRGLTPAQEDWLADLHRRHVARPAHA